MNRLLDRSSLLLTTLGEYFAYEISVGMNGRVWVNASTPQEIIKIVNCIKNSEYVSSENIKSMVKQIVEYNYGADAMEI